MKFRNTYEGEVVTPKGNILIGNGNILPYDLIFGALGSCMFVHFLEIADKKKILFDLATVEVTGDNKKSIPRILKWVNVKFIIQNGKNEKGLQKSIELASKYCSVYQTLSVVAKMSFEIEFV
jgi:putative redox protein